MPWQGCQLVNPYEPERHCVEPAGHEGPHHLEGQWRPIDPLPPQFFMTHDGGADENRLVELGHEASIALGFSPDNTPDPEDPERHFMLQFTVRVGSYGRSKHFPNLVADLSRVLEGAFTEYEILDMQEIKPIDQLATGKMSPIEALAEAVKNEKRNRA